MAQDRAPVPLGDVLDRALRSLGTPSAKGVEVVFDRWEDVVGPQMASRTRPARIDDVTLVVTCDEPAVATHLRYLQAQLVERLAQLSGERRIRRIDVQVSRRPRSPRPPRPGGRRVT